MTKNGVSPNFETEGNFTTMKFENESQNRGFHKFWNLKIYTQTSFTHFKYIHETALFSTQIQEKKTNSYSNGVQLTARHVF